MTALLGVTDADVPLRLLECGSDQVVTCVQERKQMADGGLDSIAPCIGVAVTRIDADPSPAAPRALRAGRQSGDVFDRRAAAPLRHHLLPGAGITTDRQGFSRPPPLR